MVWVGLKKHLVPIPLSWARSHSNGSGCSEPHLTFLNTSRDEVLGHAQLLWDLFQCLTTLTIKNLFLVSNLKLPSFSLKPFPLDLSVQKALLHLSLLPSSGSKSFWSLLFSRLKNSRSLCLSLKEGWPLIIFVASLWTCSNRSLSHPYVGHPRVGHSTLGGASEEQKHIPRPSGHSALDAVQGVVTFR